MTYRLIIGLLAGAAVGGVLGYVGKCTSGTCMLVGNPFRGILTGAIIGLLMAFSFRGSPSTPNFVPSRFFHEVQSNDQFSQLLRDNGVVMVDFYANWCGPCRQLKPTIHSLADEYGEKIKVVGVNVDELPELARQYEVRAIPRVMIFHNGDPMQIMVGSKSREAYVEALSKALGG